MNKLIDGITCDGQVRWEFMRVDRNLLRMGEGSQGGQVMSDGRIKEGFWVIQEGEEGEIWGEGEFLGIFGLVTSGLVLLGFWAWGQGNMISWS
jgi:hypothetical protein